MKEDIENELRDISPFLAGLKKEQPFKTPKFYFDTLADRVIEKTQPVASPQYKPKKSVFSELGSWISTLRQPRWAMAMATIAILAVGSWFYLKKETLEPIQPLSEITNDDIHQYIKDNIDDFDEDLFAENDSEASNTEGGINFSNMSENEIELYLKENLEEKDLEN